LKWKFDNDRSISAQISETIQKGILSGVYPPGSGIPSVRALAVEAGVNPNTMQKALAELEAQGLLHTQRTSGRTVTSDEKLITELRQRMATSYIDAFFQSMMGLGIEPQLAIEMLTSRKTPINPTEVS